MLSPQGQNAKTRKLSTSVEKLIPNKASVRSYEVSRGHAQHAMCRMQAQSALTCVQFIPVYLNLKTAKQELKRKKQECDLEKYLLRKKVD